MDANLLKSQISLWRKRNILGDAVGGESLSLQVDEKSADAAAGPTIKKAAAVLYSTALYGPSPWMYLASTQRGNIISLSVPRSARSSR